MKVKSYKAGKYKKDRKKTLYEFIETLNSPKNKKYKNDTQSINKPLKRPSDTLKENINRSSTVIYQELRLKNELNALQELNKIYKAQLTNGYRIEEISSNAARRSELIVRGEDLNNSSPA